MQKARSANRLRAFMMNFAKTRDVTREAEWNSSRRRFAVGKRKWR